MQQLMKRIDPINAATEHQKVSTFMRGLESCYKFHIRANNPITLADAVNTTKGFELSYNELATQPMGIVQNNNANTEIVVLLGEMQKQISTFGNQNRFNNDSNGGNRQQSNDNSRNRNNNNQNYNNNRNDNQNSNWNYNQNSNNNRFYYFNDSELADFVKNIMKENRNLKD